MITKIKTEKLSGPLEGAFPPKMATPTPTAIPIH